MKRRVFLRSGITAAALYGAVRMSAESESMHRLHAAEVPGPEPAPKIKIGQIGTAHSHAAGKLDAVRKANSLFEVVGVVEPDNVRRDRVAKSASYAGMRWLDEEELLATPGLQAVVVETALADSAPTASRVIAAGKHIHLDKPGAVDHEQFKQLRFAAERSGLVVQMGYMLRYNPAFVVLFQAAREGAFGEILEIDCAMGKLADDRLRNELADIPGHGMFELACHIIDATVTLLGKPERVHAFGKASRSEVPVVDDNQLAVLEYSRAVATVRCNHADPFGGPHRMFRVVGTKGAMEITPLESGKGRLMLTAAWSDFKKGEQQFVLPMAGGRYDAEFADLSRVIRGEKKLAWDAAHDVAVHETVLRAAGIWN